MAQTVDEIDLKAVATESKEAQLLYGIRLHWIPFGLNVHIYLSVIVFGRRTHHVSVEKRRNSIANELGLCLFFH